MGPFFRTGNLGIRGLILKATNTVTFLQTQKITHFKRKGCSSFFALTAIGEVLIDIQEAWRMMSTSSTSHRGPDGWNKHRARSHFDGGLRATNKQDKTHRL